MSFIGIKETAFFSADLQKEMEEYARKKISEKWKVKKDFTGSNFVVTSECYISFTKNESAEMGE